MVMSDLRHPMGCELSRSTRRWEGGLVEDANQPDHRSRVDSSIDPQGRGEKMREERRRGVNVAMPLRDVFFRLLEIVLVPEADVKPQARIFARPGDKPVSSHVFLIHEKYLRDVAEAVAHSPHALNVVEKEGHRVALGLAVSAGYAHGFDEVEAAGHHLVESEIPVLRNAFGRSSVRRGSQHELAVVLSEVYRL